MKRVLTTAILLLTFFWGAAQLIVDDRLQPHYDRFQEIINKEEIPVDWSKIKGVLCTPLKYTYAGYAQPSVGVIYINQNFWNGEVITESEFHDLVLLTLAHEVGHILGWEHIDSRMMGLMNPTSKYDLSVVRGSIGVEQYILNTYIHKLCN